jgi:beta-N-acetylhexosaminidase
VLAAILAGCGGDELPRGREKHPVVTTAAPAPAVSAAPTPRAAAPEVPAAARRRSASLPLDQRVGQLFLVGFDGTDLSAPVFAELAGHGWGGVVIGAENAADPGTAATMAGEAKARAAGAGRVEPLVAAELDAVAGVTLELGPDVDVPGTGTPTVSGAERIARRAVRETGVARAIGHFPGQGAAGQDPLEGPAQVGLSERDLRNRDLVPFIAVADRAPVIVVSSATYLAYDAVTPAAQLPAITRDLLRGELRFGGVAMTDELGSLEAATGQDPGTAAVGAIRAGIDLVHVPDPQAAAAAYDAVLAAVRSGELDASRVRDACARVLALKQASAPATSSGAPPAPSPG